MPNVPHQRREKESVQPPASKLAEDILFVPTQKFRERFQAILAAARTGKTAVIHSGSEPRAIVRCEPSGQALPCLDHEAIHTRPQKYVRLAASGKRFFLVDGAAAAAARVVLQPAGSEWIEPTREYEPPGAAVRRYRKDNRETIRARDRAAYTSNPDAAKARNRKSYKANQTDIQERRRSSRQQERELKRQRRGEAFAEQLGQELGVPVVAPVSVLGLLSDREQQTMFLLLHGCSNNDIAKHMELTIGSVKTLRIRLFRKLGVPVREGRLGIQKMVGL